MLVVFMTGMAFSSLQPRWLAHEFDHDRLALAQTYDHTHDSSFYADPQNGEDNQPFDDAEHKLLHVLSHCAQAPCDWQLPLVEPLAETPPPSMVPAIVTATTEPLFRPPRSPFIL